MSQFIGIRPPPGNLKRSFDFSVSTHNIGGNRFLLPHNFGTYDILVQCFTDTGVQIQPAGIEIVDANNVLITFSVNIGGRCIIFA